MEIIKQKFDTKKMVVLTSLIITSVILSVLNISFLGIKLHSFQLVIFFVAMCYGPLLAGVAGGISSIYSSIITGNPYIILFNILLGYSFGKFYKTNPISALIKSVLVVYPLITFFDFYVVRMAPKLILTLIISLSITNILWVIVAKKIKDLVKL